MDNLALIIDRYTNLKKAETDIKKEIKEVEELIMQVLKKGDKPIENEAGKTAVYERRVWNYGKEFTGIIKELQDEMKENGKAKVAVTTYVKFTPIKSN